nr:hypothetical protein [Micromonospora sp. DSM 115978]
MEVPDEMSRSDPSTDSAQWTVVELGVDEELPEHACQSVATGGWGDEGAR